MAKHANNLGYESDTSSEYPDALESLEPAAEGLMVDGEEDFDDEPSDLELRGQHSAPVLAVVEEGSGKKKKKKKQKKEVPYYMRKSRRTRKILIVAIVLLILLIGALGYLSFQLVEESHRLADEHAQEQQSLEDVEKIEQDVPQDVVPEAAKKTSAPNLVQLMGLNLDEALEALQRGAVVTSTKSSNPPAQEEGEASAEGEAATAETTEAPEAADDGDPIKTSVTISLTEEPVDVRTGTPTVYLGLDKDGLIIQAGYSASAALLGYGAYSFVDAVENNYIVERTLQEAGIAVPEGTAKLPDDKDDYRTYATDGTTIMKEHCPFSGSVSIQDVEYQWSSVLSYDYSVANAGGASNLSDTIRIIYVYLEHMPA